MGNLTRILFLSLFLFSFSVQGIGIKRIFFPDNDTMIFKLSAIQEKDLTLDENVLPVTRDPITFYNNLEIYEGREVLYVFYETVIDMLRSNTIITLYQSHDFDNSVSSLKSDNSDISLIGSTVLNDPVDKIISFIKQQNLDNDMKFLIFTYLLHNEKISDKDILKFIDFMKLPNDFVFKGKNLNRLEYDSTTPILSFYFSQRFASLNDKKSKEDMKILQQAIGRFFSRYKDLIERYSLTTFSHELVSSFRVSLIEKMIQEKKLNPKVRNFLGNTFLHSLGSNYYLKKRNWVDVITHLMKDSRINFNTKNMEGFTFLTALTESGFQFPIEFLVKNKKSDIFIKDIYNRSLFQIAAENKKYDVASYLYKKGGDKINQLSYLNSYVIDDFRYIILEPTSYFSSRFLTDPILETIQYKFQNDSVDLQNRINTFSNFTNLLDKIVSYYENQREHKLHNIFLDNKLLGMTLIALRNSNINFLKNIILEKPDIINTRIFADLIKADAKEGQESQNLGRVLLTDMLTEAIRYNQPESVKFVLDHIRGVDLDVGNVFNPLTTAIMTTFLIDYSNTTERAKSLKIINMLIDQNMKKIDLNFSDPSLHLKPIELAALAGLLNVVKKLHEEHGISLPFGEEGILGTGVDHVEIANFQGFKKLSLYYEKNFDKDYQDQMENLENCHKTFH